MKFSIKPQAWLKLNTYENWCLVPTMVRRNITVTEMYQSLQALCLFYISLDFPDDA